MKLHKYFKKLRYLFFGMVIIAGGCADLAVPNENSPSTEEVLATPADIESLVSSSFVTWWQAVTDEFIMGVRVGADIYTASWGNFDMQNRGTVPRIPYNNTPTASGDTKLLTEELWYKMYGVHSDANDFLTQRIENDVIIPSQEEGVSDEDYTKMVEAAAYLLQGLTFGELGLYYDQAFIFDETTSEEEVLSLELSPYQDVLAAADAKLQKAAETASSLSGVTLGDGYISGYDDMDMSTEFVQLCNTMRARYMVLGARTPEENASTDWNAVKSLTADGITTDFAPEGDDNFWYNYLYIYENLGGWWRVDQRVISLMDPSQPSSYPTDESTLGEATSDDARLESDFTFQGNIPYPPSRGRYFFSHYEQARYDYHTWELATGPMPYILKAENDLMWAEAVAHTSDAANYAEAADRINTTRVDRGELDPVVATDFADDTALEAIQYEREIELFSTGFMQGLGDQRRFGKLIPGSMLQYPVPAKELMILQEELYTFGGGNSKAKTNILKEYSAKSLDEIRLETKF